MSEQDARVLIFSERNVESPKWQVGQYEFEDVIADVDDVNLLSPSGVATSAFNQRARQAARRVKRLPDSPATRVVHKVAARGARRPALLTSPAIEPAPVTGEYSLFFANFMFPTDIPHLLRLDGWRDRCERAACVVTELWSHEVEVLTPFLKLLSQFDHVFLLNAALVDRVSEMAGVPCSFLAPGVDVLNASPAPAPPRDVDFFQFGRRSAVTHQAALDLSRAGERFYLYDTVFGVQLPDYRTHREQMYSILKRSKYCFNYRNGDALEWARGEDVMAPRFFESAACGAVQLGSAPSVPQFGENFDWPDAVIPIPYNAHDLREIVADLDAQPERLARARTLNVSQSLRRHDWVHRWGQILDAVEMPPTQRMAERTAELDGLADLAERRGV